MGHNIKSKEQQEMQNTFFFNPHGRLDGKYLTQMHVTSTAAKWSGAPFPLIFDNNGAFQSSSSNTQHRSPLRKLTQEKLVCTSFLGGQFWILRSFISQGGLMKSGLSKHNFRFKSC